MVWRHLSYLFAQERRKRQVQHCRWLSAAKQVRLAKVEVGAELGLARGRIERRRSWPLVVAGSCFGATAAAEEVRRQVVVAGRAAVAEWASVVTCLVE